MITIVPVSREFQDCGFGGRITFSKGFRNCKTNGPEKFPFLLISIPV